jgi:hypothetical protein
MTGDSKDAVDLDRLFKLRVVVGRFGEMDAARWWNTTGQLGKYGATALRRGFPRSHYFAQARSVFAVAAHRCSEVFDPPGCATLWRLPEAIEEEFEARWELWLDDGASWIPFFQGLEELQLVELALALQTLNLIGDRDLELFARLRRTAEGRAVPLPGVFQSNADVNLLALGFARSEPAALAVPYIRCATA